MQKKIVCLFSILSISTSVYAALDSSQSNSNATDEHRVYEERQVVRPDIAQRDSGGNPRSNKNRRTRQDYWQGRSDYDPRIPKQYDPNEIAPSSDARWYKNRSGRQEYLKGGGAYPRFEEQYDQTSPSSDARWYKSRSGREEYLKGGSDYPRG